MNIEQIKTAMADGEWVSFAPDLRPSALKSPDGSLKPFYLSRAFKYATDDTFELAITNFADPNGKVALARMRIQGHIVWQGAHPIAADAQKVKFSADTTYDVT